MDKPPIVTVADVWKSFGPITALEGVSFELHAAEITAMVGDNGAGKSTMAKMISGVVRPDRGEIRIGADLHVVRNPLDAIRAGVQMVYQDLALVPTLDVTENMFLGRELVSRFGWMKQREMKRMTRSFVSDLQVNVPQVTGVYVSQMSGGQRQALSVARAAFWAEHLLILDEPTAALGVRESKAVLELLGRVKESGIGTLMISHAMPHVMEIADRVLVMRHGRLVADLRRPYDLQAIVGSITGVSA